MSSKDHAALVARLRREAHDLDAAYRTPEDGPSSTAQVLLDAADALTDCRAAVRAALQSLRATIKDDPYCPFRVLLIIDAKLAEVEREP